MNNEMKQNVVCYPSSTKRTFNVIDLEKKSGITETTINVSSTPPTSISLPKGITKKLDCTLEESYSYCLPTKSYFCNENVYNTAKDFLCQSGITNEASSKNLVMKDTGVSNAKFCNFDINYIDAASKTLLDKQHITTVQRKYKTTENYKKLKALENKYLKICMTLKDSSIIRTNYNYDITRDRKHNEFQWNSNSSTYYNYPVTKFMEDLIEYYHDNLKLSVTNQTFPTIFESTVDESLLKGCQPNNLEENYIECKKKNQLENKKTSVTTDEITLKCNSNLCPCSKGFKSSHHSTDNGGRKNIIESKNTHQQFHNEKIEHKKIYNYKHCALCFNKNCTCRNVENPNDEMSIENSKKVMTDLQDKEAWGRQCHICFQRFMKHEYFTHIRHSHLESYPHQCVFCKFMCQDLNQLRHHVKKKHKTDDFNTINLINNNEAIGEDYYNFNKSNIEEDILSDEDMNLLGNTRKNIKNNVQDSFICPLCFRKLKTLPNLKKHIMQHSYKKLQCYFCKFASSFKGQMCSHYNQEHPSERLNWKEVFLDVGGPHQLIKDIEPYLLQVKIKYGVRKPNKKNSHIRQYQCPHCDYICNFNSSYNRHLRIHGGKKPFKCGHCNFHAREAYVIRKHSKIKHPNQEVKIEKDIGYNVPYRYSKQSKITSTKNTKIKSKIKNDLNNITTSIISNETTSEKVQNLSCNEENISNPFTLKNIINPINPSLIFKDNNQMMENEIEKSQGHSNYETNKELKNSYVHTRGTRVSKEVNVVSSNRETVYSINTHLNKFNNINLHNAQVKRIYESDKSSINMSYSLLEESENVKHSHQSSVNAHKSRVEFKTDVRSLMPEQYPRTTDKHEISQEISNINKDLSRVDVIDNDLKDKLEDDYLNLKKKHWQEDEALSETQSIVLCEDNDFSNETVVIRICSVDPEKIIDDKFETRVPNIEIDNIKEMYESFPTNGDTSINTYDIVVNSSENISQCNSFLSLEQEGQECSKMIAIEKEIQDTNICESLQLETKSHAMKEYENFKDSATYQEQHKKDKELNVHQQGLELNLQNYIGCTSDFIPVTSGVTARDMLDLDYQNRDYFSPDKTRNMMKILGNGRIECSICSVTTTRRAFYKHAKKHFNIKPFQCGYCNYRSIEKSKIRVHNSFCHPGSQCIIMKLSPKTASLDLVLLNHESTEDSDITDFSKNVSGHSTERRKLISEENVSIDLRAKENESFSASYQPRWFRCPVCQKELRHHLPTLRRHLYTHFNYKPFKCGICPFTASAVGEIRGHHVTHRSSKEAEIESSGAVMHPDLAKLLEDNFGYSQLGHHEIDFNHSKKKINRKNLSVSKCTLDTAENEETLSSTGSEGNICTDSTNYKERNLNEFHLSSDCISENCNVKHVGKSSSISVNIESYTPNIFIAAEDLSNEEAQIY